MAAPYLWALLLVEVGGAGVEHHGLDGEVLGVLLPVALLHLPLHLTDPCTTQHALQTPPPKTQNPRQIASCSPPNHQPFPARALTTCSTRPLAQQSNEKQQEDLRSKGPVRLPFATAITGARPASISTVFSLFSFVL